MKKIILLSCITLCLTACAQQPASETSSLLSTTASESSGLSSSQGSSMPMKAIDHAIQKMSDDLRDSAFKTFLNFASGLETVERPVIKSAMFSEGLAQILLTEPFEPTVQLEHGTLEAETDHQRIQIEVMGDEHWTQIDYYLLTDSYGELAGRLYVEVTLSTEMLHDMYYYNLANATCYLYSGDVFQKTIDLIESKK